MAANIGQVIKIFLKNPIKIVSNPWTSVTSSIAIFGNLIIDSKLGNAIANTTQVNQNSLKVLVLILALATYLYGIWSEAQTSHIYTKQSIVLPIVINISNSAKSVNALWSIFNIIAAEGKDKNHRNNLAKYLNIAEEDLIFEYKSNIFDRERLKDFLKITKHNLERLQNQNSGNTTFYLAYIGPISVAVMVGGLLGTCGVKIFQYRNSSKSYYPVVEIRDRELKENVQEFKTFDIFKPKKKKYNSAVVAIDIASHKLNLSKQEITKYGDVIYLGRKNNVSTIGEDEDWLRYSREIYTVLNNAQRSYQEIKLIYSMPVTLGIILGMAIQNYWNIVLTNYDRETNIYKDLIKTNEITYYF